VALHVFAQRYSQFKASFPNHDLLSELFTDPFSVFQQLLCNRTENIAAGCSEQKILLLGVVEIHFPAI